LFFFNPNHHNQKPQTPPPTTTPTTKKKPPLGWFFFWWGGLVMWGLGLTLLDLCLHQTKGMCLKRRRSPGSDCVKGITLLARGKKISGEDCSVPGSHKTTCITSEANQGSEKCGKESGGISPSNLSHLGPPQVRPTTAVQLGKGSEGEILATS